MHIIHCTIEDIQIHFLTHSFCIQWVICIRNDIDQELRNSVIMEEIYNGLGPVQDTSLREDSLIYSGFSAPQEMTDIDMLLLRLLYHPSIRCGMNKEECKRIITEIYY